MFPSLKLLTVASTLYMAAVAEPLYNKDRPARQTAVLEGLNYDAGLSPAPTPGPGVELRNAHLEARALGPDTCGFYHLPTGGLNTRICTSSNSCWASKSWLACGKNAANTVCHDGSNPICDDLDNLPANHLCCMRSESGRVPFCATFIRSDDDGVWRTLLGCGNTNIGAEKTLTLIADKNVMPPTYTTGATDASSSAGPTSSTSPTPSSPSDNSSSSNNTGAIAGGVVGGVAVIAIAACVIVWMVLRKRRASREEGAAIQPTPGYDAQSPQPYVGSPRPQQGFEGYEEHYKYQPVSAAAPSGEHYKYQPVSAAAPTPEIHEVPGDNTTNDRNNRAELG